MKLTSSFSQLIAECYQETTWQRSACFWLVKLETSTNHFLLHWEEKYPERQMIRFTFRLNSWLELTTTKPGQLQDRILKYWNTNASSCCWSDASLRKNTEQSKSNFKRHFHKRKPITPDFLVWVFCLVCFQLYSEWKCLQSRRRISPVLSARTSLRILLSWHVATASVKTVWRPGGEGNKHRSVHFVWEDHQGVIRLVTWH